MKKLLLILLIQVSSFSVFAEGGMSGGGGNIAPDQKYSVGIIEMIINQSVKVAQYHFQYLAMEYKYFPDDYASTLMRTGNIDVMDPILRELTLAPVNIVERLKSQKITILKKAPCLNAEKEEKDGSVDYPNKGDLCISAFLLKDKIAKGQDHKITSLLVHEFSHLFGFDETKAMLVQDYMEAVLTIPTVHQVTLYITGRDYETFKKDLAVLLTSDKPRQELCPQLVDMSIVLGSLLGRVERIPFNPFGREIGEIKDEFKELLLVRCL